jgi:hypothetical protein
MLQEVPIRTRSQGTSAHPQNLSPKTQGDEPDLRYGDGRRRHHDCDVLRAGRIRPLLGGWVAAAFNAGHASERVYLGMSRPSETGHSSVRERPAPHRAPGELLLTSTASSGGTRLCQAERGVWLYREHGYHPKLMAGAGRAGSSGEKLFRDDSAFWTEAHSPWSKQPGSTRSVCACRSASQTRSPRRCNRQCLARGTRLIGVQAEVFPDWRPSRS